ncbi:bifunctional acetate--CoA ligase family protein/GNAT family N-acetyltransferase [Oceanibaculum sp.]|uniref:bifunctional acetate--CoA ligase family protein/GNAT family N-acetyltransferase n=1 Tax=Oceanibaculum sp. TaxID=1903597 RepID=UPI00258B6C99|nr:bifunctional acetate--CoA ligase family protein/GNAT family N-acetyltransferase [Oceanibaculum sp.]MCH2394500.1 bifunctional acetate--CoA ligase family protein/GNAT family N-acetyltransferase [Oceanibaculum sp.]
MSVRNLDYLFKPASVALIGASTRAGSVGAVVARNLFNAGFRGPVMPVNPHHRAVEGVLAYPDVAGLPVTPDLAVICTPPDSVPGLIADLGARGTRAAIVITAGLGADDGQGGTLRQAALDAAKPHLLRIVGPNCLGIMAPGAGLNASFAHIAPRAGDIAFVTQSGAMVTAVLDWAASRGIGFSQFVSLGDMADVDFGDMLDYLAADPATKAVLLYIEAVTDARKFMSAARACARLKPVIIIKAGRHAEGARAAASHTGALAGADAVYDAAFRRAGALRVYEMRELFDAVETLATARPPQGERLAILTNGGGPGVLATDALIDFEGTLADLAPATLAVLDAALPATWSRGNPVDIIGDAPPARYAAALKALLADPNNDAVLVLNCPTAVADSTEVARAIIETAKESKRTLLTNWLGDPAAADARHLFTEQRIPTYHTPEQAVRGFMDLVRFRRNQALLMETPPSLPENFAPDRDRAGTILRAMLAEGRDWLSESEAKQVLAAYQVPVVPTRIARTPAEAATHAEEMAGPVALKILSPDITHKSDAGGVALNLETSEETRQAAEAMLATIRRRQPEARLEGFTVQPMIRRAHAHELIVGMVDDRQFGPVLLFGQGGTAVELLDDKALALPPLNMKLARETMEETRIIRLLRGYRDRPAADLDAIALTLIKISQLVCDFAEVAELDINPLLADEKGVIALDARIRVAQPARRGTARLAIRPYPQELEQEMVVRDGSRFAVRPIRPEDGPALQALFARLAPEDIRMRFFQPLKSLPLALAARLTQIDYDREMALIASPEEPPEQEEEISAVVRISCDPDNERAEYAILVRSDLKGRGIGYGLMKLIIAQAKQRGVREVFGDVLRENQPMLQLCRDLGFTAMESEEDPTLVRMVLPI